MCPLRVERSSDQVVRPLYQEALTKWVGHIPDDVVGDMANIAPMLEMLGYDPAANPPTYGVPEETGAGVPEERDEQRQSPRGETNVEGDRKRRRR